jgi:tetratricopeptide (TPR) repeat protein
MPNASTLFFTWPWVFYGQLLLLIPVFLLGWCFIKRPYAWRREWTVLGFMALAIGISVIFSRRPAFSLESALFLWSGLAWCGLIAMKASAPAQEPVNDLKIIEWGRLIGLAFLLPLLAGLLYWLNDWYKIVGPSNGWMSSVRSLVVYRNLFPFGHWNYTGGFAVLALPWFGTLFWTERGRWRVIWLASAIVGVIMFFSASSRGAVLGMLTALAAMFAAAIYTKTISRKQTALFALAGFVLAAGLWTANPRLRAVIASPSSVLLPSEGDIQRLGMLQGGWLLFQMRPWVGHGPGMTPFVYPEVRARLVGGVETAFQLHNGPIQLLVDHGVFGIICGVALVSILFLNTRRWLIAPRGAVRTFALASALSLAGYFVMFVTDYQLNLLPFVAALGLHSGLVLAAPMKTKACAPFCSRWAGYVLLGAIAAILIVLAPAWRARETYWSAWNSDNPAETLLRLERTAEIAPRNPYFLNQLALRRARLAEMTTDAGTVAALLTQARAELTRSLALDPSQEPIHAALAWLLLRDDPRNAEVHFRHALALLPDREFLHYGLALSLLTLGNRNGGVREVALECLVNPLFFASAHWQEDGLATLRADALEQLTQDLAFAIAHPCTPAWRRPQLAYAVAFARWWNYGILPSTPELAGTDSDQHQFFNFLSSPDSMPSSDPKPTWFLLYVAMKDPTRGKEILCSSKSDPPSAALAGALARLALRPTNFAELLRSPAPRGIGLFQTKIARMHYSIMNCVIDGPGYEDLAPRTTDAFHSYYTAMLFPSHGCVPSQVIIDLMQKR